MKKINNMDKNGSNMEKIFIKKIEIWGKTQTNRSIGHEKLNASNKNSGKHHQLTQPIKRA